MAKRYVRKKQVWRRIETYCPAVLRHLPHDSSRASEGHTMKQMEDFQHVARGSNDLCGVSVVIESEPIHHCDWIGFSESEEPFSTSPLAGLTAISRTATQTRTWLRVPDESVPVDCPSSPNSKVSMYVWCPGARNDIILELNRPTDQPPELLVLGPSTRLLIRTLGSRRLSMRREARVTESL